MKKFKIKFVKKYLVSLYNGDRNNAIVEAYNLYRRDNTSADMLETFEWLPNNENTLKIILNDNEYLLSIYDYCKIEKKM